MAALAPDGRRPKGGRVKEAYGSTEMANKFESIRDSLLSEARNTGERPC